MSESYGSQCPSCGGHIPHGDALHMCGNTFRNVGHPYWKEVEDLRAQLAAVTRERDEARGALEVAVTAMRHPLDGWKGEVERKALDAARLVLSAGESKT
jgi:hypothetical protein